VDPPVVLHGDGLTALLPDQVFVEKSCDRVVHGQVALGADGRGWRLLDLRYERSHFAAGLGRGAGVDGPVHSTGFAVCVAASCDG
jgi:hypothetical protein